MAWYNKEKKTNERIVDVIAGVVILMMIIPYICNLNVPFLNTDELGYWGSASFFVGYDWSSVISTNSYFSYGYGMILALLLKCIKNPIICFKVSIVLNAFFLIGLYIVLKKIVALIKIDINIIYNCIISLTATLYCSLVTYAGMSLPECLLAFLYAINVYLVLCFFKNPCWIKANVILLLSLYMYIVHQRTIVLLVINMVYIVGYSLISYHEKMKRNVIKILITLICFCLLFWGLNVLKKQVQSNVWLINNGEVVISNDFSGQMGKIKFLFSIEGIREVIYSFCGRIFYCITATYGFIILFFMILVQTIRNKQELGINKFFYIYIFMSTIASIIISCVFLIIPSSTTYLFYGRYSEYIMPIIIVVVCMVWENISVKMVSVVILIMNLLGIVLDKRILDIDLLHQNTSVSSVAMNRYYEEGKLNVLVVVLVISLIICVSVIVIEKKAIQGILICIFLYTFTSIHIGYQAVENFYKKDMITNIEQIIDIAKEIEIREIEELCVIVTDEDMPGKNDKYGKIIQFMNPNLKISLHVKFPNGNGYFVAHKGVEDEHIEVLKQNDGYLFGVY